MNIAGIVYPAYNGYSGIALEIFVAGCNQHCPNCHNPELQDFAFGKELDLGAIHEKILRNKDWIDWVGFLGGEPLDQDKYEFMRLVVSIAAKHRNVKLKLFTGHELDDVPDWCFDMFDEIKYGPYVEALKTNGFPSSSNQGVWVRGGVLN